MSPGWGTRATSPLSTKIEHDSYKRNRSHTRRFHIFSQILLLLPLLLHHHRREDVHALADPGTLLDSRKGTKNLTSCMYLQNYFSYFIVVSTLWKPPPQRGLAHAPVSRHRAALGDRSQRRRTKPRYSPAGRPLTLSGNTLQRRSAPTEGFFAGVLSLLLPPRRLRRQIHQRRRHPPPQCPLLFPSPPRPRQA